MSCSANHVITDDSCPCLCFVLKGACISGFFPLLQKGITVRAQVGCSVRGFLREQAGLTPETIERIQSIILDGRPVDDLDRAIIKEGSTLALSAAMPGLVGATLRRGGAYSTFRSTITHHETDSQATAGEGLVQVKIFNLLMAELGPVFLKKGVVIKSSELRDFLAEQPEDFRAGFEQVLLDGKTADSGSFLQNISALDCNQVFLCVRDAA